MNKMYETKYNAALNAWVAVPEIAKSAGKKVRATVHSNSATMLVQHSAQWIKAVAASALVVSVAAHSADTLNDKFIKIDESNNTGATVEGNNAIAIGPNAKANDSEAIAIGKGATVDHYDGYGVTVSDGIAIGTNAKSVQGSNRYFFLKNYIPGSTKGIAIGRNTYSNESTVDIGAKSVTHDKRGANRRAVTSVGADSFAAAHFATIVGSYSDIKTNVNTKIPVGIRFAQGFASTITGTLNTIKANSKEPYDGILNIIDGAANKIEKANGSVIIGGGNTITNAIKVDNLDPSNLNFSNITDVNALNKLAKEAELGSVGVFGGSNTVDNAILANVQGVKNTLQGGEDNASSFVSIDGYKNSATDVKHLMTQGSHNTINYATENMVFGNWNKLNGTDKDNHAQRNIILGFQDENSAKIGSNLQHNQAFGSNITIAEGTEYSVLIGDEAQIKENRAVALGSYSIADRAALNNVTATATPAGNQVYALDIASQNDKKAIIATVKGDLAAVSVGNDDKTRQIINVAAGRDDSDAVNVAQLKAVANLIKSSGGSTGGGNTGGGNHTPATVVQSGDQNINVQSSGHTYTVSLARDINVDSVKAGDTLINNQGVQIGDTVINNQGMTIKGGPGITKTGIDGGGKKITNIAAGDISANSTDAVNGGQFFGLRDEVYAVDKRASAGTAAAIANGSLAQAYLPGKSMVSASVSNYHGESALAIGVSTISDNGKWILKGSASANSADVGVSLTAGFQW